MRGVASGDTIVHWLLLGDSIGEKTSKGVSSGDDEIDDTNVASSSSPNGNFLRGHGNTTSIVSSYNNQISTVYTLVLYVKLTVTSSGLSGILFTIGEGAGLLGDGALSALERSLPEPRLLLLATAHMCRKRCCSSCSHRACLVA